MWHFLGTKDTANVVSVTQIFTRLPYADPETMNPKMCQLFLLLCIPPKENKSDLLCSYHHGVCHYWHLNIGVAHLWRTYVFGTRNTILTVAQQGGDVYAHLGDQKIKAQ